MKQSNIITGIDVGTSKISVIVCDVKSAEDIEILGLGTSILKGVQKGIIKDKVLFLNSLQNSLKRAQAASNQTIQDIFINIPNGNNKFSVQTGIIQNTTDELLSIKYRDEAMKKSMNCIEKKDQSILHLIPITQRVDGVKTNIINSRKFETIEIDTGIILGDSANLKLVISEIKSMDLKVRGIISDFLSLGSIVLPSESSKNYLIIDCGAQLTSLSIYKGNQLIFAHTIEIGSEQITNDLSICLKCSFSEAERIKILFGQLKKFNNELAKNITINSHNGQKKIKASLVTSIIESRINQLFQLIQKYLIYAPGFDEIILTGSGSNLKGVKEWASMKLGKPIHSSNDQFQTNINITPNYIVAMGQIIYGYQRGLLKNRSQNFIDSIRKKFFIN